MTTTEFQFEPTLRLFPTDEAGDARVYHQEPERLQSGIESLTFGLQFRDWLSDHERNLLDMLAPEHAVTFLIHGDRYLHPEDVPLFPVDVIQTSLHQGGEAIFVQRYEPESGYGSDCYKIHTARIGRLHGEDLILGILGPDHVAGSAGHEEYFSRLAGLFRRSWPAAISASEDVRGRLTADKPVVIINRASGRVLAASDSLPSTLNAGARDIAGIESGELIMQIQNIDPGARLRLENTTVGNLHLCFGRIDLSRQAVRRGITKPSGTGFLMHSVRNRLTAVSAAAGHLEAIAEDRLTEEEREFLTIIQNEVLASDRFLQRMKLLLDYPSMTTRPVSLVRELDYGLNAVRCDMKDGAELEWNGSEDDLQVTAVHGSIQTLVDAIVRSHTSALKSPNRTSVTVDPTGSSVEIRFETVQVEAGTTPMKHRDWTTYADSLATAIGAKISHPDTGREKSVTIITLPKCTE